MGEQYEPTDAGRWADGPTGGPTNPYAVPGDWVQPDEREAREARRKRFLKTGGAAALTLAFAAIMLILLNSDDEAIPPGTDEIAANLANDADGTSTDSDDGADDGVSDGDGDAPADDPPADPPVATGTTGDAELDQMLLDAGIDPGNENVRFYADAISDIIDSIRANNPTFDRDDIDIVKVMELVLRMATPEVIRVFNQSTIECGATEPFLVVCPAGVTDMPEGEVLALGMTLEAPVSLADTGHSFTYSAVFDSDGDPANDWVFNPPFDFDLFQGADRWYQLEYSHTTQTWSVSVSQVDVGQTVRAVDSSVRVAIGGNNIVFFVPRAEVGDGAYRLTSFGHDGAFSESDRGADVSGTDPTEPLTVPTAEPIETAPQ